VTQALARFIFAAQCLRHLGLLRGMWRLATGATMMILISCDGHLMDKGTRLRSHTFRYPATSDLRGLKCVSRLTVTNVTFPPCTFGIFSCSGEGASPIRISLWQVWHTMKKYHLPGFVAVIAIIAQSLDQHVGVSSWWVRNFRGVAPCDSGKRENARVLEKSYFQRIEKWLDWAVYSILCNH
jgi:hypothetical protein